MKYKPKKNTIDKNVDTEWPTLFYNEDDAKVVHKMRIASWDCARINEWAGEESIPYRACLIIKNMEFLKNNTNEEIQTWMLNYLHNYIMPFIKQNNFKAFISCHKGGERTNEGVPHLHIIVMKKNEDYFSAKLLTDFSKKIAQMKSGLGFHCEPVESLGFCMNDLRNSTNHDSFVKNLETFGNDSILLYKPSKFEYQLWWCLGYNDYKPLSELEVESLRLARARAY